MDNAAAPLELFECPRHPGGLRLTATTCTSLWRKGQTADPWEAAQRCRGCAIGAGHASPTSAPAAAAPLAVCVWCGATSRRLLGHPKLLCVSCYNRLREQLSGHYRRKTPPIKRALCVYLVEVSDAAHHRDRPPP